MFETEQILASCSWKFALKATLYKEHDFEAG